MAHKFAALREKMSPEARARSKAIADRLRARKVANIERLRPDVIATGNIGCISQIAAGTDIPIVHTAALLDWATGGPLPKPIEPLLAARAEGTPAAMPEAAD